MAILYGFAARCLFGVVFLHNAKQGKLLLASVQPPLTAKKSERSVCEHVNRLSVLFGGYVTLLSDFFEVRGGCTQASYCVQS